MIKTTDMLIEELKQYSSPRSKLSRMARCGEIYPIIKGIYETDRQTPGFLLAGSIYGPSYISFDYALSHYGMIPETVYTVTCASYDKKKKKRYDTPFGSFSYRDIPNAAFPFGILLAKHGEYYYRIANPEKALCDKLYTIKPTENINELLALMLDDLRIDENELKKLDRSFIKELSKHYHSTNVKRLSTALRRL